MRSAARIVLVLSATLPSLLRAQIPDAGIHTEQYRGRGIILYTPPKPPPSGTRALVVVLHGGLGNASRIENGTNESGMNMDAVAAKDGFFVVYLNGTPVTRRFGKDFLGWNAGGGCCGVPAQDNIDDVAYITAAVRDLTVRYGIDPQRVYAIGHSNGAMMTTRMMCETTLFRAGIAISGPLNLKVQSCPGARGHSILSIHGALDQNVPIAGGRGTKGLSETPFNSEQYTERTFTASGADFHLQIVPEADHALDHIEAQLRKTEGMSLSEKAARFFGLNP